VVTALETIRSFATEKLEESSEGEDIRRAHAEFFRALAEEAEPHLIGPEQRTWLERLANDHDNIRAAVEWSLNKAPDVGANIANSLWRFWDMRGHVSEGRRWFQWILERTNLSPFERMRATQAAALLADVQGDFNTSIAYGNEALLLARKLGSAPDAARALIGLGWVALLQGDLNGAASAIEEAVALSEGINDPHLLVRALNNLAAVRSEQHRSGEALRLYERSAEIAERSGDRRGVMMALLNAGELSAFTCKCREARDALERVRTLAEEFHDPSYEAGALLNLGIVNVLERRPTDGMTSFQRALELASRIGSTYLAVGCLDGLALALGDDLPTAARLFAASDAMRARADLPRSSGEKALFQPQIDALGGVLTEEARAEIHRQIEEVGDLMSFARAAAYEAAR